MNGHYAFTKRVAQMCSSLTSEGHRLIGAGSRGDGTEFRVFRHPNGRRLKIIARYPVIALYDGGRLLKTITCLPVT